ncbi:MAG: DUF3089 domain-containing protein [Cytophagales bacterium]|nr:DUF3089 domain-containing protein [Bernardetiaceae bacterium]MDW8203806.1 DUF3089 domain-containing protein [Cytophagales bacterium]
MMKQVSKRKAHIHTLYSKLLKKWWAVALLLTAAGCASQPVVLQNRFEAACVPAPPNYSHMDLWAAHPNKQDAADRLPPVDTVRDEQANAPADVFFIHPTIYTYKPTNGYLWNGSLDDVELNRRVDSSTILNQASIFNGAGRVFAPRYRQAHLYAYFTPNAADAQAAFDTAYADVKAAFEYYLQHFNQGRPFIIAAHSQGTQHAKRLMRELIDGKPLQQQLIVAYLVGMPTPADFFANIPVCQSAEQTGCFVTWNTYAKGYTPANHYKELYRAAVTNPLNWTTNGEPASAKLHRGAVGQKFKPLKPALHDAMAHKGMLWISRPKVLGAALLNIKNWHRADYNLFYFNVRQNAAERVRAYLQKAMQR